MNAGAASRVWNLKDWGLVDYGTTFEAMQDYTRMRDAQSADALWFCQHTPVYTQGLAGKPEHLLSPATIPVVASNRGGQVTYHGPGQVVAYPLVDLRRQGYFVKEYVYRLEEAVIRCLNDWGVTGLRVPTAPGIYVRPDAPHSHARWARPVRDENLFQGLAKISALGVKVSRHCTYHGLALNVAMDLTPFLAINPCGYVGLRTVDLHTIGVSASPEDVQSSLQQHLTRLL